jgi:CBS domain-containing protein
MRVREAMTKPVLMVGPDHTLRQVAERMAGRRVGSAIVIDPDSAGVGIFTERDVLNAIGAGLDPDTERVGAHLTREVVYAGPNWTLPEAATAMARGGFRHLVVMEGPEVLGIISVRDIMRVWVQREAPVP